MGLGTKLGSAGAYIPYHIEPWGAGSELTATANVCSYGMPRGASRVDVPICGLCWVRCADCDGTSSVFANDMNPAAKSAIIAAIAAIPTNRDARERK